MRHSDFALYNKGHYNIRKKARKRCVKSEVDYLPVIYKLRMLYYGLHQWAFLLILALWRETCERREAGLSSN
jgi:hypothetical protein